MSEPETSMSSTEETETLTGEYRSVQGVMHRVSCFCSTGGILTLTDGTEVNICLDNGIEIPTCKMVELTGSYKTVKRDFDDGNPCRDGTLTLFYAEEVKCGE